ncbi:MAG: ABC1 kinase family protein [Arachnia sp.]
MILSVVAFLVNTGFLFSITRRLIGVPVGWVRTLGVAMILTVGMNGFIDATSRGLGLDGNVALDLSAVAVVVVIVAWGIAIGVGALVILEALVPTGSITPPVVFLRDLPARWRRGRRYTQIVRIATQHGLGSFLRAGARFSSPLEPARLGRQLRVSLTQAGVTFVKLGQMLATRPDLIGSELATELGRLQADVPPQPWEDTEAVMAEELGPGWRDEFTSMDEIPIAAASVGQVHGAVLADGTSVAVKIQRAGAYAQAEADLDILLRMARWLERTTVWGKNLGVRSLAEGFASSITEELDYTVEAANATAVGAASGDQGRVRVPAVYKRLSTSRVLIMERAAGVPLSRPGATDLLADQTREELAQALLSDVLNQVLSTGVFHADLHAGNVLVQDADESEPRLVLLDFGSVGRLDNTARDAMGRLLFAVDRDNSAGAVDALCEVLDAPASLDDRALERELGGLISRVKGGAGTADLFGALFSLVIRHGFTVPPQVAAAFRALGAVEGTLHLLNPGTDLISAAQHAGQEHQRQRLAPEHVRDVLTEQLVHALPVLQRLPRRLDALAATAQAGQAQIQIRWLANAEDRAFISGLANQLTMTLLATALAACSVVLLVVDIGPLITPTIRLGTVLGSVLGLFGFILAARVLAVIFRRPPT